MGEEPPTDLFQDGPTERTTELHISDFDFGEHDVTDVEDRLYWALQTLQDNRRESAKLEDKHIHDAMDSITEAYFILLDDLGD